MKRIPQLDGLRAVAILLVISFHYINNQLTNDTSLIAKIFCKLTSFGWIGVDLFFVLSGFLIGNILIKSRDNKNYFRRFYSRRILRIIPNYYLLLLIYFLVTQIGIFKSDYFLDGNQVVPFWSYILMLQNFFMASFHNMGNSAMSVTWSIAIEEQFYLIIPLIIYFIKPKHLPYLLFLLIILANIFRYSYPILPTEVFSIPAYVLLPCRMDSISFGLLIAYASNRFDLALLVNKYIYHIIGVMFGVILTCGALMFFFNDLGIIRHTLFALFFSSILTVVLVKPELIITKILSLNILTWIGRISYSLYLFHYLILGIFKVLGAKYFEIDGMNIFLTSLALTFSFIFSYLIYKYVETPFVKLGKS